MKKVYILLFQLLLWNMCVAQKADSVACPLEGRTPNDMARRMNVLKNRDITAGPVNRDVTIDSILKGGREDTGRYKLTELMTVTGYVLGADDSGPESCNCFSNDTTKQNIKIYLGQSINSWKDSVMVVEITPKLKKLHPEIYADGLTGQQITITGYMMYNFEAKRFALNACKTCRTTDRKTAWEICPVTDIKVLSAMAKK